MVSSKTLLLIIISNILFAPYLKKLSYVDYRDMYPITFGERVFTTIII